MSKIQPGDIRIDKLIPTRALYIVGKDGCSHVGIDEGESGWWETNIGCIEEARIGDLIDHEDPNTWEWRYAYETREADEPDFDEIYRQNLERESGEEWYGEL